MADPEWLAVRNCGPDMLTRVEWRAFLKPENEEAWPAGYALAKMIVESRSDRAVLLPTLHYTFLATAYAELDPACIGRRGGALSHIGIVPANTRAMIRGYLLRYNRHVQSSWIDFAGVRVGIAGMPEIVSGVVRATSVVYVHEEHELCAEYGAALGATAAELEDYTNGPQACPYCRLAQGMMCSRHTDRRDEMLAAQQALVTLCTSPPPK